TPHYYTLSLHDALPISIVLAEARIAVVLEERLSRALLARDASVAIVRAEVVVVPRAVERHRAHGLAHISHVEERAVALALHVERSEEHTSELQSQSNLV